MIWLLVFVGKVSERVEWPRNTQRTLSGVNGRKEGGSSYRKIQGVLRIRSNHWKCHFHFLSSSTCKKCGRSISLACWVSLVVFPSGPLAGSSSPKMSSGPSSLPHGQDAFLAPAMASMVEKSCPGSPVVLGGTQTWAHTLAPPGSGLSSVMWIDNNSCIDLLWVVHGISEHI